PRCAERPGTTFNPKVAGSIPARPIRNGLHNGSFCAWAGVRSANEGQQPEALRLREQTETILTRRASQPASPSTSDALARVYPHAYQSRRENNFPPNARPTHHNPPTSGRRWPKRRPKGNPPRTHPGVPQTPPRLITPLPRDPPRT